MKRERKKSKKKTTTNDTNNILFIHSFIISVLTSYNLNKYCCHHYHQHYHYSKHHYHHAGYMIMLPFLYGDLHSQQQTLCNGNRISFFSLSFFFFIIHRVYTYMTVKAVISLKFFWFDVACFTFFWGFFVYFFLSFFCTKKKTDFAFVFSKKIF